MDSRNRTYNSIKIRSFHNPLYSFRSNFSRERNVAIWCHGIKTDILTKWHRSGSIKSKPGSGEKKSDILSVRGEKLDPGSLVHPEIRIIKSIGIEEKKIIRQMGGRTLNHL